MFLSRLFAVCSLTAVLSCVGCSARAPESPMPDPPMARRAPHAVEVHSTRLEDDYFWLRERGDEEVLRYLEQENAYTEAAMAHTAALQQQLFAEFKARLKETDLSVPVALDGYLYYTRTEEGRQYPIRCRKRGGADAPEQVLLDPNVESAGSSFFRLGLFRVSPSHRLLAYSVDRAGSEHYTLRIRDLQTGEDYGDSIENTYYGGEWSNDERQVFYTVLDDADRPWRVMRHRIGTPVEQDALVYEERDERFHLSLRKTKDRSFILIEAESQITSETRLIDAEHPERPPRLFDAREDGVEYSVYKQGRSFLVLTNRGAVNFRLTTTALDETGHENWRDLIPHDPETKLDGVDVFRDFLAVYLRRRGLRGISIRETSTGKTHDIGFAEEDYTASGGWNPDYDSRTLRLQYTSLVTPDSVYDYDMGTRKLTLLKRQEVRGGYDPAAYRAERLWAPARDGKKIPISLVYRAYLPPRPNAPCLLYGYGSYGISIDPRFSLTRVSLLDRGMVFAIAHIRGGGELGRQWYEDGKLLRKKNTFFDFIDSAEFLVREGYTSPDRLAIEGRSAGGLLIGATLNLRPDLFRAAHAGVPFVDVINTMLDDSIPLTVIEYEEWGDPNQQQFFDYMRSYSPYDNVRDVRYPDLLVTAGLNDPRVQYWEPAKWVAKLRARAGAHGGRLLLRTEMGAGHAGRSGRYDHLRETAFEYAFLLDRLGLAGS